MKKHLSVFSLYVRCSIYKVLGILALLCIAQSAIFVIKYSGALSLENVGRFESYIASRANVLCLAAAFVLITVVLCLPGTEYRTRVGYTLRRLSVSERSVFLHQAAFNCITYFILWYFEVSVIFALGLYYNSTAPAEFANNQSVFLAFYRSFFMHSLLPLADVLLWIRNFFLIAATGFAAAEFSYKQRRKKFGISAVGIVIYIILFFGRDIGDIWNCAVSIALSLIVIAATLFTVYRKEESYDN